MKQGLQLFPSWLPGGGAGDEVARRAYSTRVILILIAVLLGLFTVFITLGWLAGLFDFFPVANTLTLDLLAWIALWLDRRGRWQVAGLIPPAMFLLLGAYLNLISGVLTSASVFYMAAVILGFMLHGGLMPWFLLALSLGAYTAIALLHTGGNLELVLPPIMTISGGMIGLTVLQWFTARLLNMALSQAYAHGEKLEREVLEREQIQQNLYENNRISREFQAKLTALQEVSIALAQAEDRQQLFTMAVEMGLHRLGFERLGVWLIEEEWMVGVVGTDADGKLCDERGLRRRLADDPRALEALHNQMRATLWPDIELTDAWQRVGRGWNALAPLWNGDEALGWLAADNLLTGQPIQPYALDLLTLYGTALGHLYTRKHAEEALRASEARYRAVIDAAPVCLFTLDNQGVFTLVEGRAHLLGLEPRDLLGKTMRELHADPQRGAAILRGVLEGQEASVVIGRDGQWQEIFISPLHDRHGIAGAIGVATDITERRRAEEQQLQLTLEHERVKILTEFITYASHEFRTPLSIINNSLYLMERLDQPQARVHQARIAREQSSYIANLIAAMLKLVRLERGLPLDRQPVRLDSLAREVLTGFDNRLREKGLHVELALSPDLPPVQGDRAELYEVLRCLVENALDYSTSGGTVTVRAYRCGDQAVLEVQDTGVGIAAEDLPRIFDHFYRADTARTARGAGLGLPIARKIVDLHGGRIEVESTLGQGSTFRVLLPL